MSNTLNWWNKNNESGTIKCSVCGIEHQQSIQNCCWINCPCGARICGNCGSTEIMDMEMGEDDDEAQYWCCERCDSCGKEGCGMCI